MTKSRRSNRDAVNGMLLLDKPVGISSNTALKRAKALLGASKAGHTGNLDPIATGLLPLCFGQSTKVAGYFLEANKRYRTLIKLGESTDTGDCEGQVVAQADVSFSARKLKKVLNEFVGEQEQIPPMYSAIKVQGQRLYKYARQGLEVDRKPRRVTVYSLELIEFGEDYIDIDVYCSRGFYVRTLAQDIGELLSCGGHVKTLRRLEVGQLHVDSAVTLEHLNSMSSCQERRKLLIAGDEALDHLPKIELSFDAAYYLCRGQPVRAGNLPNDGVVRLYEKSIGFLGIGLPLGDGRVAPKRLFHTPNSASQL